MAGMVHQLTEVLQAELDNYNELLELSIQKTPIIVKGDVDGLKEITKKENCIVGNNQRLEKNRTAIMGDVAMVLNKDRDTLTLGELIETLGNQKQDCEELKSIRAKLKETLSNLKNNNEQNGILINQSLGYVDFNINVIQSSKSLPPLSYQHSGTEKQSEGRNFFDKKQ